MSIDKESSGLPEIDPHRATTKVNLAMVFGIGLFFALLLGVVLYFSHHERNGTLQSRSASIESPAPNSP